jgi:hypothetical protein
MWLFMHPGPDGTLYQAHIGGLTLLDAFNAFAAEHWHEGMPSLGVWRNACLEARVRPVLNLETLRLEPYIDIF